MKTLLILFAVMSAGIFLLISEDLQKENVKKGKKLRKKIKKINFPDTKPLSI
ncbi:MAG: hypothetical protein ABI297_04095 [Ginsengibacter sp.]